MVGGQAFFFFGWERTSPSGSDGYFLELNKLANHNNTAGISVPTRSVGDYRFKIDETGNETLVLSDISRWSGSAWVSQPISSGFDYAVNTTAITRPGGGNVPADTFIEVSLNLTTLVGLQPSCPVRSAPATSGPSPARRTRTSRTTSRASRSTPARPASTSRPRPPGR